MIPKIYTSNYEVIMKYCQDKVTLLAYELCCFYMNCEIFYFPKITHSKFNVMKQPQKQFLFKHILKMINNLKSKYLPTEFMGYIKAQFEIMKLNEKHNPLITPNMLHGKKAEYRYAAWLQMIADKQIKENENNSKISLKYLDHLMKISKNNIKNVFGENVKFQDFVDHQKKLILMAKSKQIAHVYCFASKWIKNLEKTVVDDIKKFSESENLNKCNVEDIQQIYLKYFENELSM